ncbi:hypothetical protein [Actinokineospora sp. NPDC004072]
MNAPHDDAPFAPGGILDGGVAPPVIGAPADEPPVAYDREPPTSPIPAQPAEEPRKPGLLGRLFGRS